MRKKGKGYLWLIKNLGIPTCVLYKSTFPAKVMGLPFSSKRKF